MVEVIKVLYYAAKFITSHYKRDKYFVTSTAHVNGQWFVWKASGLSF